MKVMALDLREKYVGTALSDPTGRIAFPHRVVARHDLGPDLSFLVRLAQEEDVEAIVVGLPLSLSGEAGPEAQRALDFCRQLGQATSLPIETWDERLSTVVAQQRRQEGSPRRSESRRPQGGKAAGGARRRPSEAKPSERIDALAAAVILQSYLDAQAKGIE